jgi:hypothetical protein
MVPKPRMKPRFEVPLKGDPERVFQRLEKYLRADGSPVMGQVLKEHAFVALQRDKRSLLSPYLNLSIHGQDEGTPTLIGRFSPHPHVWTGFMATYGAIGFVGLSGLVFGWARHLIGEPATMMWAAPISLIVIAFVWGAAVIGQGLTAQEMYILRKVVDRAVGDCRDFPETDDSEA